MTDLWLAISPFLLADVLNPVLFTLLVFLAGSARGVLMSTAALLGHTTAYFAFGIAIAFGFDQLTDLVANPGPISFGIVLALGLVLIWVAWQSRRSGSESTAQATGEQPEATTASSAFVTGAIVNFIGAPFALPYFAVIGQILKADLSVTLSVVNLAAYNALYMAPFLIVPLLTWKLGAQAKVLLERLNAKVEKIADMLMPIVLGLAGGALVLDAVSYFVTGEGLF